MPVNDKIIPRINRIFSPKLEVEQIEEYVKALRMFSDDILEEGMDRLMMDYDSGFRPTPSQVRRFCLDVERENPKPLPRSEDKFQDAKELVQEKMHFLDDHGAYKLLIPNHIKARVGLKRIIVDRASIKAQALCGCPHTAYDATISFGYGSWGPRTGSLGKRMKRIKDEIFDMRRQAMQTGRLDVDIPQEAIDWLNAQGDIDISNANEAIKEAVCRFRGF